MKRKGPTILLLTLLMLVGTGLIAYPFVGGWFNSKEQASAVTGYVEASKNADVATLIEKAHKYNEELPIMPIGDFYTEIAEYPPEYVEYLSLPDTEIMARLSIPSIHVDLPVYHGTSDEVLAKGVGHIYGTSLPVGGLGTHAALSAHAGMVDKRMFDRLGELKVGDHFFLTVLGEELAYQVISTEAFTPEEGVKQIVRVEGEDLVTLITCTPYGINTHRLLVTGTRVEGPPERLGYEIGPTGESEDAWWLWPLVALIVLSVGSGFLTWRRMRKPNQPPGDESGPTPGADGGATAVVEPGTSSKTDPDVTVKVKVDANPVITTGAERTRRAQKGTRRRRGGGRHARSRNVESGADPARRQDLRSGEVEGL